MGVEILVVQHGEKVRAPGDPALTALGREQAAQVATWLATNAEVTEVWSSPLRRAQETAEPIARTAGLVINTDARLRERMNWDDDRALSLADFLSEWRRTSDDRRYEPAVGDSSAAAGSRFIEALGDIARGAEDAATVVVVAHGGVTVDALRTLLGDGMVMAHGPELIQAGVPCCAITRLGVEDGEVVVGSLPTADHMDFPT